MVEIFYDLIIARPQLRTLAEVKPLSKQTKVHDMLLLNNYDDNGDRIVA